MHTHAKLTPAGRLVLVQRIAGGVGGSRRARPDSPTGRRVRAVVPAAHHADWSSGWSTCDDGRSSDRPRIAHRLGMAASTVYRVLCRIRLNHVSWLDRPTGQVIRRYEL